MGMIYITDKTREMLLAIKQAEKRSLSGEVEYLVDRKFKELGLPDVTTPSVFPKSTNPGGTVSRKKCKTLSA
jgi:predicted CopG family antitoxin